MFEKILSYICSLAISFLGTPPSPKAYDPPPSAVESGALAISNMSEFMLGSCKDIYRSLRRLLSLYGNELCENDEFIKSCSPQYPIYYMVSELFGDQHVDYEEKLESVANYLGYSDISALRLESFCTPDKRNHTLPHLRDQASHHLHCHHLIGNVEANKRAFKLLLAIYKRRTELYPKMFSV